MTTQNDLEKRIAALEYQVSQLQKMWGVSTVAEWNKKLEQHAKKHAAKEGR